MIEHYTYEGPVRVLCEERVQIGRYAADHELAFTDLLNTDESQLQHTKLCLLSSKTNRKVLKWFEAHACPTIVAIVRGGSGNLKMVRPLTDNGFNGGGLARCDIKLYTA